MNVTFLCYINLGPDPDRPVPQVGSEVGRRGRGLGMNVIAYDPYASAEKAAAMGEWRARKGWAWP